MKPFTHSNPVVAAIVGFVVMTAAVVVIFNYDSLPYVGQGPSYRAAFAAAAGLREGEEVRIAGVKVGEVDEVTLGGDHVVATFNVKDRRLGSETRASIQIKTLLGQHYLAVEPKGPGQLQPGAEIPLSRTTTPVGIVPTVQKLSSTVGNIDTGRVAEAFATLANSLEHTAPEIRQTLDSLSAVSQTISSRQQQIQQLFARAESVSGSLASRDQEIAELITASNQVLDVLHQRKDAIHQLLVGIQQFSKQITGLINENEDQLRPALNKLDEVVTVLRKNDKQISQILTQVEPYIRVFTNVGGTGPWFDTIITLPRAFALCMTNPASSLADLLGPALGGANKAINGTSAPCLPLGPAADSHKAERSQGGGR